MSVKELTKFALELERKYASISISDEDLKEAEKLKLEAAEALNVAKSRLMKLYNFYSEAADVYPPEPFPKFKEILEATFEAAKYVKDVPINK